MPSVSSTVLAALSASALTHLIAPSFRVSGVLDAGLRAVLSGLEAFATEEQRRYEDDLAKDPGTEAVEDEKKDKEAAPAAKCECPPPACDGGPTFAGAGVAAAGISVGTAVAGWRRRAKGRSERPRDRQRRARRGLAAEAAPAR